MTQMTENVDSPYLHMLPKFVHVYIESMQRAIIDYRGDVTELDEEKQRHGGA